MSRQMLICTTLALALTASTAGFLNKAGSRQVLAAPGVKTHPLPDSIRLKAELPERVLDYNSEELEIDQTTLGTLPKDTSFGMRHYKGRDGFPIDLRVVLMGHDRTSMHKPQLCLTGQGWQIDDAASTQTTVRIPRPYEYELPVVKLATSYVDSQNQTRRGVYVYWYVADDGVSASTSGFQRMWWMAAKLLKTGVLQRWAYVSCLAECPPGREAETFDRMKQFIAAAVPEFQLYPRPNTMP